MFKSKITTLVMLAGVVCGVLFVCISEYLSGSEAWIAWAYPSVFGIGALIFVLVMRKRRRPLNAQR